MALARAAVSGLRMVCTLLLGFEPKSPTFIICSGPPSGACDQRAFELRFVQLAGSARGLERVRIGAGFDR